MYSIIACPVRRRETRLRTDRKTMKRKPGPPLVDVCTSISNPVNKYCGWTTRKCATQEREIRALCTDNSYTFRVGYIIPSIWVWDYRAWELKANVRSVTRVYCQRAIAKRVHLKWINISCRLNKDNSTLGKHRKRKYVYVSEFIRLFDHSYCLLRGKFRLTLVYI